MASIKPFLLHPENSPFVRGLETQPASVVEDIRRTKREMLFIFAWVGFAAAIGLNVDLIRFNVLFLIGPTDTVTTTVFEKTIGKCGEEGYPPCGLMASYTPSSAGGERFTASIPLSEWELDRFVTSGPVTLEILRAKPEVARLKISPADRLLLILSALLGTGSAVFLMGIFFILTRGNGMKLRRLQFLLKAGKLVPGRLITHETRINDDREHILTLHYDFPAPDGQTVKGSATINLENINLPDIIAIKDIVEEFPRTFKGRLDALKALRDRMRSPESEPTIRGQPLPEPGTPVWVLVASKDGRPDAIVNAFTHELL
jgi:hypothetical protein